MTPIDKFGSNIYPKTFEQIFQEILATRKQLTKYGYTEMNDRTNLFYCKYKIVTFYADLRGDRYSVSIWEDNSALIYWSWHADNLSLKERLLAVLIELTRLQAVPYRLFNGAEHGEAKLAVHRDPKTDLCKYTPRYGASPIKGS